MKLLKGKLRSLFAALSVALVALALAPSVALAAVSGVTNDGSITVNGLQDGDNVKLYLVAETKVNDSNELYNEAQSPFENAYAAYEKAGAAAGKDEAQGLADALNQATDQPQPTATEKATNGSVKFESLKPGLYLIQVEAADGTGTTYKYQNMVAALNVTGNAQNQFTWVDDAHNIVINAKKDSTTITKSVDETDFVKAGEKLSYTVNFSIGTKVTAYKVSDKLTGPATFEKNSLVLKKGDTIIDADSAYEVSWNKDGEGFTVDFLETWLEGEDRTGDYTLTYTATVTDKAGTVENTVTNTSDSKGSTTKTEVYQIKVTKTNEQNESLTGAEFSLYSVDAQGNETLVQDKLTVDADGTLSKAIAAGTYKLVETKAPAGYDIANPVTIVVSEDTDKSTDKKNDNIVLQNVVDTKSDLSSLPTTGGPGTIAMTAAGVVLVAGAACLVLRSRKQN